MTSRPLDALLARQLKKLSLSPETEGSPEWKRFIDSVNEHYLHMTDDRTLLSRSIELSTQEMDGLRRRIESQRDHLLAVMVGISDALGQFAKLLNLGNESSADQVTAAKLELARRLQLILDDARFTDERGAEVSGIRDNLLRLADQLISLLTDAGERAAVRKELEVARAVQQLLIPPQATIDLPPLHFAGHFLAAEECGGDWWTVSELPGGRALLVVGDVTGHGISSALITGVAKATCEVAVQLSAAHLTPSTLLSTMNRTLYRMARRNLMMTSVAAIIDPVARVLTVANAGHPFPILLRNRITHPIMAEGPQLGDSETAVFETSQIEIESDDLFVCFTDGVSDCENEKGERFTDRRLRAAIQRVGTTGAARTCEALVEVLSSFRGSHPPNDDVTMVVMSVD